MRDMYSMLVNIGFLVMGIIQIYATYAFFTGYMGWPMLWAIIAAVIVGYIPIVGSILGFMGAFYVLGWGLIPSLLLFFWWPVLVIVGRAMGYGVGMFGRGVGQRPVV